MVDFNTTAARSTATAQPVDQGLRRYMLTIYNYIAGALALNGALAYAIFASGLLPKIAPFAQFAAFGALGISLFAMFRLHKMSVGTAHMLYWAYAGVLSVTTAVYLGAYDTRSVVVAFLQTAAIFGAMSLYGYTTKRDLRGIGQFMAIGFIAVLFGVIVNLFLKSSAFGFALSAIMTVLLIGMTAYDTQRLRDLYYELPEGDEMKAKLSIIGALSLFANFLFLFYQMLQFFGDRR
jgi:hypothetical protein